MTRMQLLYLVVPLAPLAAAIVAGLLGKAIGRAGAHWVTIIGVGISFVASCVVFADVLDGNTFNGPVYTWLTSGGTRFDIGFLIDRLTALMMVVVTFVSLDGAHLHHRLHGGRRPSPGGTSASSATSRSSPSRC